MRTKFAILLAILGSIVILYSVTVSGGLLLYYLGVIIVFSGVWLNASLLFFINKVKDHLNRREFTIL
jgi:hypothetical protein